MNGIGYVATLGNLIFFSMISLDRIWDVIGGSRGY